MHSGQQPIRYGWHHIEGVVFAFGISRESPENLKAIDDLMAREGESNGLNIILYHPEFEIYEIRRGGADRALLKEINFAGRKLAWIFLEDPNHDQIKNSIYVHHQAALPNLFYKSEEQACIQEQVDNLFKQVVSTNTTLLAKPKKNLPNKLLYSEWYKNKLLALSDEEVKALATATPCQYRGGPGTGKTVIVLRWLRLQAQLGKKVAFITKNIKLLEKKKNEFITQYPNVEIRFASPNELLAEKESKKANPKKIMTRERYIELLTKEIKNYKSPAKQ